MFTVDLHSHTRFFHGQRGRPSWFDPIGANLLSLCGWWRGLDSVAVTNHDYYTAYKTITTKPMFIPGVEITTTDGHALVIGPDPPTRTIPGELTPREVVGRAHDAECAAIIAHPYRRSSIRESGAAFDAVEVNGKHPQTIERVRKLAETLDLPIVGGSDAHYPFEVGRAFTVIDSPTLTPESVAMAIRDGRVEARIRSGFVDRLIRTGYSYTHKYLR